MPWWRTTRPNGGPWASAAGRRVSARADGWSAWVACASMRATTAWRCGAFTPDSQGKGYGPELGRAALAFAFDVVDLDRVVAITRPDNTAGQRSLEKFGMRREREIKRADGRTLLLYVAFNPKSSRMNRNGRTTQT